MQKARRHPPPFSEETDRAPTACMHTVSGSISLAVRRSFHLSLTVLSTIGHRLVFSLGRWSSRIQPGFHVSRPTRVPHRLVYRHFAYGTLTLCGRTFQYRSAMLSPRLMMRPHNPQPGLPNRVWALPISLAATPGISIDFFSSRYLDVSVPWVGPPQGDGIAPAGFPHSDTPGSMLACSSPRIFAACHVLRRRSVPGHPPCALSRLTSPLFHDPPHAASLISAALRIQVAVRSGSSTVAFPTTHARPLHPVDPTWEPIPGKRQSDLRL